MIIANCLNISRRLGSCQAALLLALLTLIARSGHAQPVLDGLVGSLVKQCMEAKTVEQCRDAILPCLVLGDFIENDISARGRGSQSARTAPDRVWTHLAWCEVKLGKYDDAEKHSRLALQVNERVFGTENEEIATSANNLATVIEHQGKYAEAEPLHRRALAIFRNRIGPECVQVATSLNNLAAGLDHQSKFVESERLHREALAMRQKLLGTEHQAVTLSLNNLAAVLEHQGKYAEGERFYRQSLAMRQKLFGPENAAIAIGLNNLANLLGVQAKYAEAELLHRQSLAMRQKLLGTAHPDVATSLSNLSTAVRAQGRYAEAVRLDRQALEMNQKLLGEEHPAVATSLNNLAEQLKAQGELIEAEKLLRQALAIRQKLFGAEHPAIATILGNLAGIPARLGRLAEAETLIRQALAMRQKFLGASHADVGKLHTIIGELLIEQGKELAAIAPLRDAERIHEAKIRDTASETRMAAVLESMRPEEEAEYGLLLSRDSQLVAAAQPLALTVALLRKGRAADAGVGANRIMHRSLTDPLVQKRYTEWKSLRQEREALLYGGLRELSPEEYRARLKSLRLQTESLEAQIAAALPELRSVQLPDFDDMISAVAEKLPKDSALVEVVLAHPLLPQTARQASEWGAAHYIAMLLFQTGRIVSIDLGAAAEVDSQSHALLTALRNPRSDPQSEAKTLYQQIVKPLERELAGIKSLYLSLDGTLNLVPFDALHDGTDYLIGRYRFHYLTSGRDLLRSFTPRTAGAPLVLANPDFGKSEKGSSSGPSSSLYRRLAGLSRLPGTQREADKLAPLLDVKALTATAATEMAVRQAAAPWVLHIATHGLLLDAADLPVVNELSRRMPSDFLPLPERSKLVGRQDEEPLLGVANAMNYSALVLAGVLQGHLADNSSRDGLLTAEEARSLDLSGTRLVVLSACETGRGALSAGQGVYGLRRAFLIAGAETIVTSLWRVHDAATGELMERYYGKLLDKWKPGDRLGAMIESMQELRTQPSRSHPYYWAPFLVSGQAGPLRR